MPPIFLYWSECPTKLNPGDERLQQHIEPVLASRLHPHGGVVIEPTDIRVAHPIIDTGASHTSRIPIIFILDILSIFPWLDRGREFVRLVKLLLE